MRSFASLDWRVLTALCFLFLVNGCSASPLKTELQYVVRASNFGTNGVMLIEPSLIDINQSPTKQWRGIQPQFPGTQPDRYFRSFTGFPDSLPDKLQVVWQLADLSNCDSVDYAKAYPKNVRKTGCTWTPIKGKVFHKQVDMNAIRNSRAYKRAGKPYEGNYLLGNYTLNIELLFNEGQLTVETSNGKTDAFGQ